MTIINIPPDALYQLSWEDTKGEYGEPERRFTIRGVDIKVPFTASLEMVLSDAMGHSVYQVDYASARPLGTWDEACRLRPDWLRMHELSYGRRVVKGGPRDVDMDVRIKIEEAGHEHAGD